MPTLVQRIRSNADASPGRAALFGPVSAGWRQLSWGAWWASIRQTAGGLIDAGVPPGGAVVLWAPAVPEWAVMLPAISAVGAIPVLLSPDADDSDLLLALSDVDVRHVVVGGRERMERLLVCREGGLELDRILSLDRLNVRVPRMVDLDALIERGAARQEDVERRVGALKPTALAVQLANGPRIHHDELAEASGPDGAVGFAGDPACAAAVRTLAASVYGMRELWIAADPEPLLSGLADRSLGRLCLDPSGWSKVNDRVSAAAESAGLRGSLVRASRGAAGSEGAMGDLARSLLGPILAGLGLRGVQGFTTARLDPELAASLRAHGLVVT